MANIGMPTCKQRFWSQEMKIFWFLVLTFTLMSCNTKAKNVQANNEPAFEFAILHLTDSEPGFGYEWQSVWPIIRSAYPAKIDFVINEYDIEHYDWTAQVITLNAATSNSLLQQFNINVEDCVDKKNDRECLLSRAFIVSYKGEPLYGGVLIPDYPAPIRRQYPIVYPALSSDGNITLTIRPYKSVSKRYKADDYKLYSDQEWSLIKDQSFEALFEGLGKLNK